MVIYLTLSGNMPQLSMENLPELLQISLTKLNGEQHLIHWNINSNGNTTNISMKFITPGHIVHATPVSQSGSKKSYGQYQRDMNRYMSWNGAGQENATVNIHDDWNRFIFLCILDDQYLLILPRGEKFS